jgi:hypothetical protein
MDDDARSREVHDSGESECQVLGMKREAGKRVERVWNMRGAFGSAVKK